MISTKVIIFDEYSNWGELIDKSQTATFFQTREWLNLWIDHFGGEGLIIGVYDDEILIGIVPFIKTGNKVSFMGIDPVLGGELVSDFGDIIAQEGKEMEVWEAIINHQINPSTKLRASISSNHLINNPIKLNLNFIREDSPSLPILKEIGGKTEEIDVAPYLDLPHTWDEYLNSLERHDRHELRRKIRKLEDEGIAMVYSEGKEADINDFFKLMALSNEQKRDFLTEKMKAFFREVFETFWPKKMLQLCFLKLNGKYIAANLVFLFKNHLLLYNSGFDPAYHNLAPGLILKAYMIRYAIEQRLVRFEFLRGGERYKYDLGGKERKLFRVQI